MTEIVKSMFSYAWAMSLFGVQKMADAFEAEASNLMGRPANGTSVSPMSMLGPFNPAYWMNLGAEMLKRSQPAPPAAHPLLASVLDPPQTLTGLPSAPAPPPAPAPPRAQGTGWGPMP